MATDFIAGYTPDRRSSYDLMFNEQQNLNEAGYVREIRYSSRRTYFTGMFVYSHLTEAEKDTLQDWLIANGSDELRIPFSGGFVIGRIQKRRPVSVRLSQNTSYLYDLSFGFYGVFE